MAHASDDDPDMPDVVSAPPQDDEFEMSEVYTTIPPPLGMAQGAPVFPAGASSTLPNQPAPRPATDVRKLLKVGDYVELICDKLPTVFDRVNFLVAIRAETGWVKTVTSEKFNMRKNRCLAISLPIANITRAEWQLNLNDRPDSPSRIENPLDLNWSDVRQ